MTQPRYIVVKRHDRQGPWFVKDTKSGYIARYSGWSRRQFAESDARRLNDKTYYFHNFTWEPERNVRIKRRVSRFLRKYFQKPW